MLRSKWIIGPAADLTGDLLVSVTELTLNDFRRTPGAYRAGYALSREWPRLPGAVGQWLWAEPLRRRLGSVSVWRDRAGLRGFVGLPAHVEIMRKYRHLGTTRATTWHTDEADPLVIWRAADRWLKNEHVLE
ncbi:hypothetical protein [Amycolatopsis alba]|uniref:DUF3291 domain-containing protein n=2 Tax=Amycolatopsis TaxID=1813 RepID=A0A229S6K3_AMYAL|nr:hypothetical protein [Amycolatopsis alba]OXM54567.1 hypothetical protein CFP75_03315 [Amycolatopsis alba DSM 44262]QGJ79681.1 hypothetical protein [Amycolatopsis sp. CP2808]